MEGNGGQGSTTPIKSMRTPAEEMIYFNKFGAYTIPVIAVIAWAFGMSYCAYIGGGWNDIEYGDFATHPTLMLTAFLLVGSFSVCSYKLCEYAGLKYGTEIQIGLNTLVVVLAWLGWYVIFELHSAAGSHYKGSHSRLGCFVLIIWSIYYVMGFYVHCIIDTVRSKEIYRACGIMAVVVAMWTAALGVMWEEYTFDSERYMYERARSGAVVGGIMLIIFLIVGMFMFARMLPKMTF